MPCSAQLGVLARYCERSAVVVNTTKTKVLLLAGARTAAAAVAKAQAAGLTFAGVELEVVSSFRYLGILFAARQPLTAAAAPARTQAARQSMGSVACRRRGGREHPGRHVR
jgi:hypothetical protein